MVDLDDLPALALFALVVDSQSFAEAGRRAGLAKSAVSQRVARLEERLGVQLLRRSTRKLVLTNEGLRLYEHAAALLKVPETATQAIQAATAAVVGRVRINTPTALPSAFMVAAFQTFLDKYPDVTLELTLEDRFVDLVESGYDIVIRLTTVENQTFVARRLARDRSIVVASPAYVDRFGRPERPEDLLRHRCLHYTAIDPRTEWRFGPRGARYSIPIAPKLESNEQNTIIEAAIAGLGLMTAPSIKLAEHVRAGRLQTVLDGYREDELGVFAITTARRFANPVTRALIDHLARHFASADLTLPRLKPSKKDRRLLPRSEVRH